MLALRAVWRPFAENRRSEGVFAETCRNEAGVPKRLLALRAVRMRLLKTAAVRLGFAGFRRSED